MKLGMHADRGERQAPTTPAYGTEDSARLDTLAAVAAELDSAWLRAEVAALAERVAEGRFYVACIGEFKRGKSTLLNALVGHSVLPTGLTPVTAVPTVLRHGERTAARVRLTGAERWQPIALRDLAAYVTEEANPGNEKGVTAIEVFLPSLLLAGGLCLVDTPGLGSVFEANSAATREFVPHIDAALVVLGADPPLSGEELEMVESVARQVDDLIVVINKIDRFQDGEWREAAAFTQRVLAGRLGRKVDPIFGVSALERLQGGVGGQDWERLRSTLEGLSSAAARRLVHAGLARGIDRLAEQALDELDEARDALTRPLADSERRLRQLQHAVRDVAHDQLRLGHLLSAEQEQISRAFGEHREAFVRAALPVCTAAAEQALASSTTGRGPTLRREAIRAAEAAARRQLESWLAGVEREASEMYREAEARFLATANGFLARLRESGAPGLEHLPPALEPSAGLHADSHFYFRQLETPILATSVAAWALDVLLPPAAVRARVAGAARAYAEELLARNATRVQNDLDQRLRESRRGLESRIQRLLREVCERADRALERARALQSQGEAAVRNELDRLLALRRRVMTVLTGAAAPGAEAMGPVHGAGRHR